MPKGAAAIMLALAAVQGPSLKGTDLDFARHLYAQGEYRLAAEEFARFVASFPDDPSAAEASFLAADCWVQLGEWGRARAALEGFLASYPASPWAREATRRLAAVLFEMGSWARAESLYAAMATREHDPEAWYWAGEAAFRAGEMARAAAHLAKVRGISPELQAWALRRRAEVLWAMGRTEEAMAPLRDLVGNPQAQPDDFQRYASLLLDVGRPAEAAEVLASMSRRWPGSQESRAAVDLWARALWEQGKRLEAIETLRASPRGSPHLLAWMLLEQGDALRAAQALEPAMASAEGVERAEASLLLASAWRRVGRLRAADSLLAVEIPSMKDARTRTKAQLLRARVCLEMDQAREAKRLLAGLPGPLPSGADSVERLVLLAQVAGAEGDWLSASSLFLEAREKASGSMGRHLGLQALMAAYRAGAWDRTARIADALAQGGQDSTTARALFWKAEARSREGLWEEAERAYHAALNLLPTAAERADALFGRAWALASLGRLEEATEAFKAASALARRGPRAATALLRAADLLMAQMKPQEAASAYREAAAMLSTPQIRDEASLGLGKALAMAGQVQEALRVLEDLFSSAPSGPLADDALFAKAEALFDAGRYEEAEQEYRRVVALQRDRSLRDNAAYRIGDCQYNRGDYQAARATYLDMIQAYPESEYWTYAVQGALWATQQAQGPDAALALCDSLLARTSEEARRDALVLAKAELLYALERCEEALPLYQALKTPAAQLRAAWCMKGTPAQASEAFERVARQWPDAPEAAEALYQAARFAVPQDTVRAKALIYELLAHYPHAEVALAGWYELGTLQSVPDSAREAWRTVASMGSGPWQDKARLSLAQLYMRLDAPDSALFWVRPLLTAQHPLGPQAHWVAASAHRMRGDLEEARRLYLRLAYLFPSDSLAASATEEAKALAGSP